jgi:PAS domain S-box-containing protein
MRPVPRSTLLLYALAVLAPALSLLVRWPLWPLLDNKFPYITFFPAILLTAYCGGLRPGLLATTLSAIGVLHILLEPPSDFRTFTGADLIGFGLFLVIGVLICCLSESLLRARRRSEASGKRLRASEARYRVTLASIGDAVLVTDSQGRVTFLNALAQELTGWNLDEAVGRPLEEVFLIVNETTRLPVESPLALVVQEGRVIGLGSHTILRARDGGERPIENSAAPIRDDKGQLAGTILVFRDVTAKRRAEQERELLLRRLEAERGFLETVLRQMPGGVVIAEAPSGRIVLRNELALRLFPEPNPVTGLPDYERFRHYFTGPAHASPSHWPLVRALTQGEVVTGEEMDCVREGTSPGTIRASAAPVRDAAGRVVAAIATFIDITDRKRTEESLRFLAQASDVLASSLDPEAALSAVARLAVPRVADWCAVHIPGEEGTVRLVTVVHPDPAKVALAQQLHQRYPPTPETPRGVCHVLQTGESTFVPDVADSCLTAYARDAEHLALVRSLGLKSCLIVPLRARGRTLGSLTFATAESGRHYGPDDLGLAEDLARRAALAVDNARLFREATEADRRKDEFLAVLGHELRNPLAPVRNSLHILRNRCDDDPKAIQVVGMMERQVTHMVRLVDDLLDVSRIARGKLELRKQPVDLAALVARSIEAVRPFLDERQHRLGLAVTGGPLRLEADPARLEQVLSNLLHNAGRYTQPGGRIRLTVGREGDFAVLRVQDNGIGIRREMLPRIFDMFTQADRVPGGLSEGLGLGLTLVRSLVEMHGGMVSVSSPGPGRGSEFVVHIPLAEEMDETPGPAGQCSNPSPAPAQPLPNRPLPGGRRLLVVDDNIDGAESLALLLRLEGHEVRTAYDGPSALQAAVALRPEAVLLDIGLPKGMDGYEVARRLRRQEGLEGILLVAVTGYGQDEDRRRTQEAGFDAHLVKPVELEEIRQQLTAVAGRAGRK